MKIEQYELSGGLTFPFNVTENVAEFDRLAGREGACHDAGVDNIMYRGPFAKVREALAQKVEAVHAIARNTKPHPNKEKAAKNETVYDESPGKYLARVAAELEKEPGAAFQAILDELITANNALPDTDPKKIVFDPKESVGGGAKEPGKTDVEAAKAILAAGVEKAQVACTKMAALLGREVKLDGDEAANLRTLALAYKEYRQALVKVSSLVS